MKKLNPKHIDLKRRKRRMCNENIDSLFSTYQLMTLIVEESSPTLLQRVKDLKKELLNKKRKH